tara:strand:+ start:722 stop:874 length:153 start_codon:yes stop_codon:yes gene_type:complete
MKNIYKHWSTKDLIDHADYLIGRYGTDITSERIWKESLAVDKELRKRGIS